MRKSTDQRVESRLCFEQLEEWVREKIQSWVQELLEEEVSALLGRGNANGGKGWTPRRATANGYGKPRRLTLSSGSITVRRPRARNVEERFESRILPLFAKRSRHVRELIPELYLHGLALGDFELALRGLLGEEAAVSAQTVARLKADRTKAAKRFKKVLHAQAVIWKMLLVAEKRFRRLKSPHLMKDVHRGVTYVNGVAVKKTSEEKAA